MANISTDSESAQDAQTELKRRARRRLVGAVALALAAVIVLPMVMDHEPRPIAQDIQVRIPSQDNGGIAARILPAKPPTPLPPAVENKPAVLPAVAEKPAEKPAEAAPAPRPEAKPEPKPAPKPETKPEVKPEAKKPEVKAEKPAAAKPAPAVKPAEKPAEKKDDGRAAALLGDAPAAQASSQWVVQLGAYKDAGNVKLLTAKLKEMGVPTYTEKYDSPQGLRTRVRAGPFATKEAADKAQAKAKAIGVNGPVAPK